MAIAAMATIACSHLNPGTPLEFEVSGLATSYDPIHVSNNGYGTDMGSFILERTPAEVVSAFMLGAGASFADVADINKALLAQDPKARMTSLGWFESEGGHRRRVCWIKELLGSTRGYTNFYAALGDLLIDLDDIKQTGLYRRFADLSPSPPDFEQAFCIAKGSLESEIFNRWVDHLFPLKTHGKWAWSPEALRDEVRQATTPFMRAFYHGIATAYTCPVHEGCSKTLLPGRPYQPTSYTDYLHSVLWGRKNGAGVCITFADVTPPRGYIWVVAKHANWNTPSQADA